MKWYDNPKYADNKETKISESTKHLKNILSKKHLINVFRLDNDEIDQTIEIDILKAFINSNENFIINCYSYNSFLIKYKATKKTLIAI